MMYNKANPPIAESFDINSLIAIAKKEGIHVQYRGAQIHFGWDTVVLSTLDGWILRFPRTDHLDPVREASLLKALQGHFAVEIPNIEYLGSSVSVEMYRRIEGHHLSLDDYAKASRKQQLSVASSIARTLEQFHSLDTEPSALGLELSAADPYHLVAPILRHRDILSGPNRDQLARIVSRFEERWCTNMSTHNVIHSDFHLDNMSFSAPCGEMFGLWDFSCVELGEPSYDFRYLSVDAPALCLDVISAYEAATGREVDFAAAKLAGTVEAISDGFAVRGMIDESLLWGDDEPIPKH